MTESKTVRQVTLIFDPDIKYDIKVVDQETGKEVSFDITEDEEVDAN